jgi:hypothetical protein
MIDIYRVGIYIHRQQVNMSRKVLLNRLYRYKNNNLCQALHKIIAITFKQTCKIDVLNWQSQTGIHVASASLDSCLQSLTATQ